MSEAAHQASEPVCKLTPRSLISVESLTAYIKEITAISEELSKTSTSMVGLAPCAKACATRLDVLAQAMKIRGGL